jgi:hypothetical protein
VVTSDRDLGGGRDPVSNAVNLAQVASELGGETLMIPVSARRQPNDLSDEMATKISVLYYADAREALIKALGPSARIGSARIGSSFPASTRSAVLPRRRRRGPGRWRRLSGRRVVRLARCLCPRGRPGGWGSRWRLDRLATEAILSEVARRHRALPLSIAGPSGGPDTPAESRSVGAARLDTRWPVC